MQVAFFVVPGNDFGTRTLFSMVPDPLGNLFVGSAGGNERPKIIIINLGKFQPALIERTVGMVLPFPAYKHCATLVHGARRQHVASQRLTPPPPTSFPTPQIAPQHLHFFEL